MEQRIIKLSVKNEYILGEGVVIGAAGSHDEVLLELDFRASPVWHGTTKKAIFYDAMYKNPATILLTTNLLAAGQTDVYYVPVPQAAKTAAGDCFLTVEGTVVEGSGENAKETVRVTTKEARFPVLPNKRYLNETPITPTQAEQLQAEIDDIKNTVSEAKDSADAAEASKKAAAASEQAAAKSETAAKASETAAAESAKDAAASKAAAAKSEANAKASETAAKSSETEAGKSAADAATSAGNALASANSAAGSATDAENAAQSAAQSAASAADSAVAAAESKEKAAASEANAKASEEAAQKSASAGADSEKATAASKTAAETAQGKAEAAQSKAEAARDNAAQSAADAAASKSDAQAAKTGAANAATAAAESQSAAAASKNAAKDSKDAAAASAQGASNSASAAAQSAADAVGAKKAAESWAVGGTGTREGEDVNNAKYWCESAQAAAGGGVTSFKGRGGAVVPQSGDYTSEMVGADPSGSAAAAEEAAKKAASAELKGHTGKKDNPHGVTAAQAGADPAGTANSKVTAHNESTVAHADIRTAAANAAKDAATVQKNLNTHDQNTTKHITASEREAWNGKQGKLTGTAGQFVGFDADGNAVAVAANSSVTVTFTANDWTGDDEPFTLTIPQASHKRSSADFTFDAYSLCSDGKYAKNTWAVLELDVEYTAATGAFKLMSDTKFAGKIVFAG